MLPRESTLNLLLGLLLAACITRLWLMPLPSSFWVDEMATVFVVHHGPNHPSFAVAPQVPDSIYYQLPRAAESLFGFSEIAYRLPSVLLMGMALFLIARLAARLIHPGAAWFAVFVCLSMRGINDQAADARPYALGTCLAAASLWFLIRWLDSAPLVGCRAVCRPGRPALARSSAVLAVLHRAGVVCAGPLATSRDAAPAGSPTLAVFALLGVALLPVLIDALTSLSPRHRACHRRAPDVARPAHLAQVRPHPDLRRGRFCSGPAVPLATRVSVCSSHSS